MASGTVNSCCGCIDLNTGCMIIGYLKLIMEIFFIIAGMTGMITGGVMAATAEDAKGHDTGVGIVAMSLFVLLLILFSLVFTILLLVGIHKKKRSYLKVYLIVATILLVLSICFGLVQIVRNFNITHFIIKIVLFPLQIYFLVVIRSYYCSLDTEQPPPYNTEKF